MTAPASPRAKIRPRSTPRVPNVPERSDPDGPKPAPAPAPAPAPEDAGAIGPGASAAAAEVAATPAGGRPGPVPGLGVGPTPLPPPAPDAVEVRLLDLMVRVNDWLKFAETKNVGIVGIASGSLSVLLIAVGLLREELTNWSGPLLTASGVALTLSLMVGVWSFQPATTLLHGARARLGRPAADDNLYFFGHLAKYAPEDLARAVARRYARVENPALHDLHRDLAAQLVVNARITVQKLRLFRWSVLLFGFGVVVAGAAMLAVVMG